jgi:hypothetical protein
MSFQLKNVTHVGGRGRPAHPKSHDMLKQEILSDKSVVLGEVSFTPASDGGVDLTIVVDGKKRSINIPAKAAPRGRKPRSAASKASASKTVAKSVRKARSASKAKVAA